MNYGADDNTAGGPEHNRRVGDPARRPGPSLSELAARMDAGELTIDEALLELATPAGRGLLVEEER